MTDASQSGLVLHTYSYFRAYQDPDGFFLLSGPKSGEGYKYTAPEGTCHQRNWSYNEDGSPTGIVGHGVTGLVVDGKWHSTLTVINHADRTYSQRHTDHPVTRGADAPVTPPLALGFTSTPSEMRQALQTGQVAQQGTTTVDATPAIALSIAMPPTMPDAQTIHLTLYVDARTYQPLRTATVVDGNPGGPYVADCIPATPDNIAKAKDHSIPADYTKVDRAG
ncbi:MAG TPA: hypothetical protein VK817_13870 [Trebonia sp.]|nr:hypothetical protein [Trebonia sp.]